MVFTDHWWYQDVKIIIMDIGCMSRHISIIMMYLQWPRGVPAPAELCVSDPLPPAAWI